MGSPQFCPGCQADPGKSMSTRDLHEIAGNEMIICADWWQRAMRHFLLPSMATCLWVTGSIASAAPTETYSTRIPQHPSARVIVDNDFAGDPDGLIALTHQLLQPKTRTVLVTTSALKPKFLQGPATGQTAAAGRDIVLQLMKHVGKRALPPVVASTDSFAAKDALMSPAARAIVAEAMREDPLPLFVTCGGPLTNVAAALRLEPAISRRMTIVWIGGGPYPDGGWEYNLATDLAAAKYAIEETSVPLWQVPQDAYRQMQFSIAGMGARLRTVSPLGSWLYGQFTHPPDFVDIGGAWPLGDCPTVLLTAISSESSHYSDRLARAIGNDFACGVAISDRTIRVYDRLDARLTFDDFLALLQLQRTETGSHR